MDIAWIPVFVLTLSECVAPAGKTVCQEHEVRMQFVNQADCELALQELVALKASSGNVIVNRDATRCERAARSIGTYGSYDDIGQVFAGIRNLDASAAAKQPADFTVVAHQKRLAELKSCDDTSGVAPCKVGDIIIEAASGQALDVWRREP